MAPLPVRDSNQLAQTKGGDHPPFFTEGCEAVFVWR